MVLRRLEIYKYYMDNSGTEQSRNEWGLKCKVKSQSQRIEGREMLRVARKIAELIFANAWVWFLSLSVFPSLTGGVATVEGPGQLQGIWSTKAVFSLLHYFIFNCADWFGRVLTASRFFVVKNTRAIVFFALLQTLFIPVFMMCNSEAPQTGGRIIPTWISSDAGFFTVLALFALCNGWTTSLAFMQAPQKAEGAQEEEVAGVIQSFSMSIGCTLGSLCGFGLRGIVCRCNPFIS